MLTELDQLPTPSPVSPPYVRSDVGTLRRVVINPPSLADYSVDLSDGRFLDFIEPPVDAAHQHQELERLLRATGAEVLSIEGLLDEAIVQARSEGTFETWLRASFPQVAHLLATATAATLLGRAADVQFQTDARGDYRHLVSHRLAWTFTRDAAVMTPRGLVLCSFVPPRRVKEGALMRFMARFSPTLRHYPVVFDAVEEGLCLEGGDLQVVDEHTLLLGVGHRSDPRAAPRLAERLGMDVVAVQMRRADEVGVRPASPDDPLPGIFLHLDTCFTLVDHRLAVALPYFFEAAYADRDPLTRYLRAVALEGTVDADKVKAAVERIVEIGWVRRYAAGSGREDATMPDLKLVDYVRQQGWEVGFVGGPAPAPAPGRGRAVDLEHLVRVVLPEHRRQAANVVATAPGQVVVYDGAPRTRAALESLGVEVSVFGARDLWPWYGGPHCLTLPLERD